MSKIRTVLGGMAAVGILAVLALGGVFTASSTSAHSTVLRGDSLTEAVACFTCVGSAAS